MRIIGVAGPKGSGKTTVARTLATLTPSVIVPFAKPLKDFALQLGWDGKKDEKGRRLLQLLGTECGRKCIDPYIWVKKWHRYIQDSVMSNTVIADDVRFHNEATLIRSLGGTIIEVIRDGYEYTDDHASEQGLPRDMIDVMLWNNCSLDDLKVKLEGWWVSCQI